MHQGIFVHSVYLSIEPNSDQRAGWVCVGILIHYYKLSVWFQFGNVNEQVAQVAEQIAAIEELQGGFDAMGFSQGILLFPLQALNLLD